ncbi:MAG TPA: hypothetical protein VMH92_12510 [Acidocella sp.]|nr:hypothetical protein [Acidocella sp.]
MDGNGNAFNGLVSDVAATVMGMAGAIDRFLLLCMASLGIIEPQWQLCMLLVLIVLMVVAVMRMLGGLFGWVALLFAAVLLLDYIVPGLGLRG